MISVAYISQIENDLLTVKMAAAALGMYFVRFLRRAFCTLMAICFWILTRSCNCRRV